MGTADPDFPDPAAEARLIANCVGGHVLLVEGAGHYPHVELPERTAPPIVAFAHQVLHRETTEAGAERAGWTEHDSGAAACTGERQHTVVGGVGR
jgi:hypothetical protein